MTYVLTQSTAREWIAELLLSTRYFPKETARRDSHGMPIVEPEPDDPDDE